MREIREVHDQFSIKHEGGKPNKVEEGGKEGMKGGVGRGFSANQ